MQHSKTYAKLDQLGLNGHIVIEGPVTSEHLRTLHFHEGLTAFRPAPQQHAALIEIADLPEGRIIIARENNLVIGYVTYLHPDPLERWAEDSIENLIELGAIELASQYRGQGIAKKMLICSFSNEEMENYLVITTEYYWHWDLKGSGLNVWEYRKMMESVMRTVGFEPFATDDPEITSHPANCLMARIGKNVKNDTIERFDRLRFKNRFLY